MWVLSVRKNFISHFLRSCEVLKLPKRIKALRMAKLWSARLKCSATEKPGLFFLMLLLWLLKLCGNLVPISPIQVISGHLSQIKHIDHIAQITTEIAQSQFGTGSTVKEGLWSINMTASKAPRFFALFVPIEGMVVWDRIKCCANEGSFEVTGLPMG